MAATTAVVAGTAGAVRHHQDTKYANQAAEQQAQQQAEYDAQQQQLAAQQAPAPVAAPAPAPAAAPEDPMVAKLNQLAQLHAQGILTDEEFSSAKAKLLAS
jgi:hypothetical protein